MLVIASVLVDGFSSPACCLSRVSMSRVAQSAVAARVPMPCMCEEPAEAVEPAAEVAEEEKPARRERKPRAPKTKLDELETDVEIQGTVRSVQSYGAFVDIGAETDGLLHVSEISNEYVKDATEKLNVGDTVTVRVKMVNFEKKQVALTAKDPNAAPSERGPREGGGRKPGADISEYVGADDKEYITGTVSRIQEYGAFIALKEGVDGLVHISEIQEGGVGAVSDVLSVGQEIQVRVIKVDTDTRRIGLSMKPWLAPEDRPQRKPRANRGDDGGDDTEFKLSAEELAEKAGGDEDFTSSFDLAFTRMTLEQGAKKDGKKFSRQML